MPLLMSLTIDIRLKIAVVKGMRAELHGTIGSI